MLQLGTALISVFQLRGNGACSLSDGQRQLQAVIPELFCDRQKVVLRASRVFGARIETQ